MDDLFEAELSSATVVYVFLLPELNARLLPKLAALRPGTTVLSREFEVLGWPCGERLRVADAVFLRWRLPVAPPEESPASAVEHLLDCAVLDAATGASLDAGRTAVDAGGAQSTAEA